jgi:hypothetical protein
VSIGFCAGRAGFNAVSFLIAIPGKVSKMYDTLGDLFDKLSVFLSQFRICQRIEQYSNIDTTLNTTINELLVSFVDICGLSIGVLQGSTWGKLKAITLLSMPSTGSWLDEIQDYTSLKDGDAKIAPVLYVTA